MKFLIRHLLNVFVTAVSYIYLLGLGDRHVQNILIDKNTAEFIHIDLGELFITKALYTIPSRHIIESPCTRLYTYM